MPTVEAKFYVYEHWRPDKDVCFWVGKGQGSRAYIFKRNSYYNNIVAKLRKLGMCVEVRMVASGLEEKEAFRIERERIAFWREVAGKYLANRTDGGEGASGHRHDAETRKKFSERLKGIKNPRHSERLKGRKLTAEHRVAISKGNMGRIFSVETREKISMAQRGKKYSAEFIQKLSISHLGKKDNPETIQKKRDAALRGWNDPVIRAKRLAFQNDPEKRARWIESLRNKPYPTPEHREKLRQAALKRWKKHRERMANGADY